MNLFTSCLLLLAAAFLCFVNIVSAHMEMLTPYAFRSKYDPQTTNIDYSNTSPLNADGSNYPCKGYHKDQNLHIVANYVTGQSYELDLIGGANHGGGSCQLSLSYDSGSTFIVIQSYIGGCPISLNDTFPFTIPTDAPSGNALFAWTWFNKIGNREMYMNCALVTITGTSASSSLSGPQIFIANLGSGLGTCVTVEQDEVVMPKPGNNVIYGGIWNGTVPPESSYLTSCTYEGEDDDTGSGSSVSTGFAAGSSVSISSTSRITTTATLIITSTSTRKSLSTTAFPNLSSLGGNLDRATTTIKPTTTKKAKTTKKTKETKKSTSKTTTKEITITLKTTLLTITHPTPSITTTPAAVATTGCSVGSILCSATGKTWSLCSDGQWVDMGSVAPGTTCLNGGIVRESIEGQCTSSGAILCSSDAQSWSMCSQGVWVSMGSVAPGTRCVNGGFVAS